MPVSSNLLFSNSPRSQRQTLQLQCLGLDKAPESYYTDDNAEHIDNIISIGSDAAGSAAVHANMAIVLESAGEGFGDKITLEVGRGDGGRCACCSGEHVDEFEDEEAGECAAEVANTGGD
jgi:hypothetical protein